MKAKGIIFDLLMKNIGVFGVGGVGGFFGGKLCYKKHEQLNVTFFARGEHLERIQKSGLILKKDERDLFAGAILNYAKKYGLEASKTMDLLNRLEIIKPISTRPAG